MGGMWATKHNANKNSSLCEKELSKKYFLTFGQMAKTAGRMAARAAERNPKPPGGRLFLQSDLA
jgi:hypothetical protein